MSCRPSITPDTRVAALLAAYPELEEVLIGMAPPFAKLRNPVLRRTIAKVTSLRRAAEVAGLPARELVGRLREAAGLPAAADDAGAESSRSAVTRSAPAWTHDVAVCWTLDANAMLASGSEPLGEVGRRLGELGEGTAGVLESSFPPAPLLEWLAARGCDAVCVAADEGYRTWVRPATRDA